MGGGGKSFALARLVHECTARGERAVATTTTSMYRRELEAVGPLVLEADPLVLLERVRETFAKGSTAAVARGEGQAGKVAGVSPAAVDALREAGIVGSLFVEADGSRGLPLKTFGRDEPQVPFSTTTIVLLAGMDVLGCPLDDAHVHRAALLADQLGVAPGIPLTPALVARALRGQSRRLLHRWPAARVVVLVNKVESPSRAGAARSIASLLLAACTREADRAGGGAGAGGECRGVLDRVVLASLREGRFAWMPGEQA